MLITDLENGTITVLSERECKECHITRLRCNYNGNDRVVVYVDDGLPGTENTTRDIIGVTDLDYMAEYRDFFIATIYGKMPNTIIDMEMSDEIRHRIALDLFKYREHSIEQKCNMVRPGVDLEAYKKFVDDYYIAINVFGLHSEYNNKAAFNDFIIKCIENINIAGK